MGRGPGNLTMPQYWLLKTEPSTYALADLEREGRTTWDGVKNALALIHLRAMRPGDELLIYHSGKEKAVVGRARVEAPPRTDGKATVVDVRFEGRLSGAGAARRDEGRPGAGRAPALPQHPALGHADHAG